MHITEYYGRGSNSLDRWSVVLDEKLATTAFKTSPPLMATGGFSIIYRSVCYVA